MWYLINYWWLKGVTAEILLKSWRGQRGQCNYFVKLGFFGSNRIQGWFTKFGSFFSHESRGEIGRLGQVLCKATWFIFFFLKVYLFYLIWNWYFLIIFNLMQWIHKKKKNIDFCWKFILYIGNWKRLNRWI